MDYELILDASDSDLFDDHSLVTESPPPLVNLVRTQPTTQPSRPRSIVRILRHNMSTTHPVAPTGHHLHYHLHLRPSIEAAVDIAAVPETAACRDRACLTDPSPSPRPAAAAQPPHTELTAAEFAYTFSLYRDTICSVFPDRRAELDDYLSTILDLALRFGGTGFYTYHFLFASQAAGCLQQFNQGTHRGVLDTELYCRVFAARSSLACDLHGAPSHPASECVVAAPFPRPLAPPLHPPSVFSRLGPTALPPPITPKPPNPPPAAMPLLAGESALKDHPDRQVVHFLIHGLTFGFHPGMEALPESSFTCRTRQSAIAEPATVDMLLAKEITDGFMIGPFSSPPFPIHRISPLDAPASTQLQLVTIHPVRLLHDSNPHPASIASPQP
eukprot:superscaffoldBa00002288_g13783